MSYFISNGNVVWGDATTYRLIGPVEYQEQVGDYLVTKRWNESTERYDEIGRTHNPIDHPPTVEERLTQLEAANVQVRYLISQQSANFDDFVNWLFTAFPELS